MPVRPGGPVKEAVRVSVSQESGFATAKLEDGTVIRLKPSVVEAWRFDDEFDEAGNPIYSVRTTILPTIDFVGAALRRRGPTNG
jgi:hypothetical protein